VARKKKAPASPDGVKVIAVNKKARFNYEIIETLEAGIVLTGNEIKSIRDGGVSLKEAYVRPDQNEIFLIGAHIKEYTHSSESHYNPTRARKLLLHKSEIDKIRGRVEAKGLTVVPIKLYLKKGRAKLQIGLGRGKASPDKRKSIIDRERKIEAQRAMKGG